MKEIKKFNWNPRKMCNLISCSDDITHFEEVKINGMEIFFCLCKKHAEEWDKRYGDAYDKRIVEKYGEIK